MPISTWTLISILNYVAVAVAIVHILRKRRDPRGMFAWILMLIFLPIVGLIFFLTIGEMPVRRRVRRFEKRSNRISAALSQKTAAVREQFDERAENHPDPKIESLMTLATKLTGNVVSSGNRVLISHDGERSFLEKQLLIESAQSHVHLEFYIYADDDTGHAMSDLLIQRAQAGVEIRLLLDAVGCWNMSRGHVERLKKGGVKVGFFMPWRPTRRRFQLNCRNHRKLIVADGVKALTGSSNIADEYLGRHVELGPWEDTNLMLEGPVVAQLQEVFVEDWFVSSKEDLADDRYFPEPKRAGEQAAQIIPSGPSESLSVMHQLLYAALSNADKSVSFVTPYFVPDQGMMLALTSAAYRGVEVKLLIPTYTDSVLALWAGRSNYHELLEAGVEIIEYPHGMLHSKTAVVDGKWAMVGSVNMDVRSFRINFELTTILYDEGLASSLVADFARLSKDCPVITQETIGKWTFKEQIYAGLARMASPFL